VPRAGTVKVTGGFKKYELDMSPWTMVEHVEKVVSSLIGFTTSDGNELSLAWAVIPQ
jgi:hypothetical protein